MSVNVGGWSINSRDHGMNLFTCDDDFQPSLLSVGFIDILAKDCGWEAFIHSLIFSQVR